MKGRSSSYIAGVLGIAALYFLAAKLGLQMASVAEQVTAIWPPTGIALACLVLFGRRMWPGVFLGAFLANATAHEPLGVAAGIGVGNTLEAVVGAWLLVKIVGFRPSLERLWDAGGLTLIGAGLSTMVSATIGVSCLCLGGLQPWSAFGPLWSVWWLGDAMGNLVAAPLIFTWFASSSLRAMRGRVAEVVLLVIGMGCVCDLVFFSRFALPLGSHLAYAVFPIIIWGAVRFGPRIASLLVAETSLLAVWGTTRGLGPFSHESDQQDLILLQIFMSVVAVTSLVLSAAIAERNVARHRLQVDYAVTQVLSAAPTLDEAIPEILRTICQGLAWELGALWMVDEDIGALRCRRIWRKNAVVPQSDFDAFSMTHTFAPGAGLPGRVWASAQPCWIPDVVRDPNFPRARFAAREGLHGAFGFPISIGEKVLGVMEFFSNDIRQPDNDLLSMFGTIGSQIGRFVERKQAEGQIRESHALKSAVFETALDCIITIDHQGLVREFNPAAEATFGYTREEAVGLEMADLIIPQRMRTAHREGLKRYIAGGEARVLGRRLEMPALRKDGEEFPVELTVQRIPREGRPMFTAYLRDLSARNRAEELSLRLASIVESSGDAIFSKSLSGRILTWNRAAEKIYGYTAEEIVGSPVDILIPPDRTAELRWIMNMLRRGQGIVNHETERVCKSGARIDVSLTISPIRNATGDILGASAIARDITARKASEHERAELFRREQEARSEADAANRAKDEFLSTVSHELRTPLNAILGWAHLLQEGWLDPAATMRACETILRNARSQQRIIEDILDLSRIVSGTIRLDVRSVEVPPLVGFALDSVRPSAMAKGITLESTSDASLGPVLGDPDRIQQIVWNLLSNAIKFTRKGGRVNVRLNRQGSFVEIKVEDSGKGIRADLLPYIFDRFRQGDSTSTRQHSGLGLGLAIVRSFVELQGGTVEAVSPGEGRGAIFTVRLPIATRGERATESSGVARDLQGAEGVVAETLGLAGLKVLVVDDDADSRGVLQEILGRRGIAVTSASSAREALACIEADRPDVLISDIEMPEQDGYALIRTLRARGPSNGGAIPAVAVTAYARREDSDRARREGYQVHLSKPVEPGALIAAIESISGRSDG